MTTDIFIKKREPGPKYMPEQPMVDPTIPVPRWESTVPTPQPPPILPRRKRPRDRADLVSGR